MQFENEYDLSSSVELEEKLSGLPLDFLLATIQEQIKDPLSNNVNYVESMTDTLDELERQYEEDPDNMAQIKALRTRIFNTITVEISNRFNMGYEPDLDDLYTLSVRAISMYDFLILNYRRNVRRFLYNFIIKDRKRLIEEYKHYQKKKDVSSLNLKKKLRHKDDVVILSNLPEVVNGVLSLDVDAAEFLSLASDNADAVILQNMVLNGQIDSNFTSTYLQYVLNEHDSVVDSILVDVRMRLSEKMSK